MRIQHNIPAMNAYRNYNANTKALQGNLQKLSSGYKINKAGDDAAGLAISEKMRAQISGLEVAQKNAKDGISLVQTAEGAMTEIHTMLNRMFSLAEQSANGTYEDAVDREQLNNEFQKLTTEIDRIADSTNFNGKKLLDGTLAGSGSSSSTSGTKTAATLEVGDAWKLANGVSATAPYTKSPASAATYVDGTAMTKIDLNKTGKLDVTYQDASGAVQKVSIEVIVGAASSNAKYKINGGNEVTTTIAAGNAAAGLTAANVGKVYTEALNASGLKDSFTVTDDGAGTLTFTAKTEGESSVDILKMNEYSDETDSTTLVNHQFTETKGANAYESLDIANMKAWSADATKTNCKNTVEDTVFTVDGQKFAFANSGEAAAAQTALGNDVTIVELATDDTLAAADATKMAETMKIKLGYEAAEVNGTQLDFKPVEKAGAGTAGGAGNGLRLRVGDSTNDYDDIYVEIESLNADKLSGTIKEGKGAGETYTLDKLNVSTDADADIAMGAIKDMINYVSTERGNLGATQNRLDHTINNLSTMQENIQDAEATIRDVDVAEEMMKYTKNNILVQSAQAMLAQANQLPQGVLQLLG